MDYFAYKIRRIFEERLLGRNFSGSHFELLYLRTPDPWAYRTNPNELERYSQMLAELNAPHYETAVDLGCSVGVFTAMLAKKANRILAVDISEQAVKQTRKHCEKLQNVTVEHHDLLNMPVSQQYDLVVCAELLYYLTDSERMKLKVRQKLVELLTDQGELMTVLPSQAQSWETFLEKGGQLTLIKSKTIQANRPYRICTFKKIL